MSDLQQASKGSLTAFKVRFNRFRLVRQVIGIPSAFAVLYFGHAVYTKHAVFSHNWDKTAVVAFGIILWSCIAWPPPRQ